MHEACTFDDTSEGAVHYFYDESGEPLPKSSGPAREPGTLFPSYQWSSWSQWQCLLCWPQTTRSAPW